MKQAMEHPNLMPRRNLKYPHLLPPDVPVWERFLAERATRYSTIDYDIRVGRGRPAEDHHTDNMKKMALDLSMRRIDAVAETDDYIDIIEVTNLADLKAIGQLIAYPILYIQSFNPSKPVRSLLVAARLNTDIRPVLISHNLKFYLTGEVT